MRRFQWHAHMHGSTTPTTGKRAAAQQQVCWFVHLSPFWIARQHSDMDDAINAAADGVQNNTTNGMGPPGTMINDANPNSLPDDGPKDINNQNPY